MDFASGLANLEQAAANSQNRCRGRDNNSNNHYGGGGEDHRRYQPRPRHHDNRRDNYHNRGHNHRPQYDRMLDGLVRFGYRFPKGPYNRPPPLPTKALADRDLHICLLAITIDDLPYEDIWKAWAADNCNGRYKVSLVCHAKYPEQVKSEWLKQRMLLLPRRIVRGNSLSDPEYLSYKPAWGSVEITRAMVELLEQGVEIGRVPPNSTSTSSNPDNDPRFSPNRFILGDNHRDIPPADKFIFISETCVPVTTLDECMKALFPTTKQPSKPRWEPPPGKEVAPPAAGKEGDTDDKKDDEESPKKDDGGDPEEDKKPDDGDADTASTPKGVPTLADMPINKTSLPEEEIVHLDTSWVNARNFNSPNTPSNKYERDQFEMINRNIPKRYRWKADQWMVLSRTHATAILDIDRHSNIPPKNQLWNSFKSKFLNASDEMYFPTALSLANVLVDNNYNRNNNGGTGSNQDTTPWLERRRVTYTDWSMGMRNPASFTKGIKDFATVARLARKQKTLFARKFCPYLEIPGQDPSSTNRTGDISVEDWKKELETIRKEEEEQQPAEDTKKDESGEDVKPAPESSFDGE